MIGTRSHLAWGSLAHGPARTIGSWRSFCALSKREQNNMLRKYRGGRMMYAEIKQMKNNISQDHSTPCMWIGIFSGTGILLGARGLLGEGRYLFFENAQDGLLKQVTSETFTFHFAGFYKVRILMYEDGIWNLDPNPKEYKSSWKL